MTSIADLTPCTYGPPLCPGELAVGWLDVGDSFPTGKMSKLLKRLVVDRLTFAAAYIQSGTDDWMGTHACAFCDGPKKPLPNHALWGNGEFRVIDENGATYVAPSLIAHYISEHDYLPPTVFIEAVAAGQFLEQPRRELNRPVSDRIEPAPASLSDRVGATAVVRGHLEGRDDTPGPPFLGFAIARRWYGPWDGSLDHADALLNADAQLGFLPESSPNT